MDTQNESAIENDVDDYHEASTVESTDAERSLRPPYSCAIHTNLPDLQEELEHNAPLHQNPKPAYDLPQRDFSETTAVAQACEAPPDGQSEDESETPLLKRLKHASDVAQDIDGAPDKQQQDATVLNSGTPTDCETARPTSPSDCALNSIARRTSPVAVSLLESTSDKTAPPQEDDLDHSNRQ
ncbi:hypothetical protein HDU97_008475, partial [Phlyctochytrium planicorne]